MNLRELARNWHEFGQRDAMWSILTIPGTRGNRWKRRAFFRTGGEEVAQLMGYLASLGAPARSGRALDFGCGVGRVTQALARHFDRVDGVDIAPSMIAQARRLNRHGDRCVYHVNDRPDLAIFPDGRFDLVYSVYVLQHMEPRYSRGYVAEFVRLLAPGGIAVFQLPTEQRRGRSDPLPAEAFRSELTLERAPRRLAPGSTGTVRVWVRNTSPRTWPMRGDDGWYQVSVGGRWRAGGGELAGTESRAALPADLGPGDERVIDLEVVAPGRPSAYVLEVDLVQEGVAWFQDHGAAPARAKVLVAAPRLAVWSRAARAVGSADPASPAREPTMEMHNVSRAEVLSWVEAAGGRVVDVGEILSAGREFLLRDWDSALYAVSRR